MGAEEEEGAPEEDEDDEDVDRVGCVSVGWRWWWWFLSPGPPPQLLLLPLLSLVQSVLSRWSESPLAPVGCSSLPPWLGASGASCRWTSDSPDSLLLFFLPLRAVLGTMVVPARFLPKAKVKVGDVARMPMVVVVVALGGSMSTSSSVGDSDDMLRMRMTPREKRQRVKGKE